MTGRSIMHDSLAKLLAYILRAEAISEFDHGIVYNISDVAQVAQEMQDIAELASHIKRPVWHLVLSWRPDEFAAISSDLTLTIATMHEAAAALLGELELTDHQAIAVSHWDLKGGQIPGERNYETHLAVNRIGFDSKIAPSSFDFSRVERAVAKIALDKKFLQVPGRFNGIKPDPNNPLIAEPRATPYQVTPRAERVQNRTGAPTIAEEIRADPKRLAELKAARLLGWKPLIAEFAHQGVGVALGHRRRGVDLKPGLVLFDLEHPLRRQSFSKLDRPFEKWGRGALEKELGPLPFEIAGISESGAQNKTLTRQQAEIQAQHVRDTQSAVEKDAITMRPDTAVWTQFQLVRKGIDAKNLAASAQMQRAKKQAQLEFNLTCKELRHQARQQRNLVREVPLALFPLALFITVMYNLIGALTYKSAAKKLRRSTENAVAEYIGVRNTAPTWSQFKRAALLRKGTKETATEQLAVKRAADIAEFNAKHTSALNSSIVRVDPTPHRREAHPETVPTFEAAKLAAPDERGAAANGTIAARSHRFDFSDPSEDDRLVALAKRVAVRAAAEGDGADLNSFAILRPLTAQELRERSTSLVRPLHLDAAVAAKGGALPPKFIAAEPTTQTANIPTLAGHGIIRDRPSSVETTNFVTAGSHPEMLTAATLTDVEGIPKKPAATEIGTPTTLPQAGRPVIPQIVEDKSPVRVMATVKQGAKFPQSPTIAHTVETSAAAVGGGYIQFQNTLVSQQSSDNAEAKPPQIAELAITAPERLQKLFAPGANTAPIVSPEPIVPTQESRSISVLTNGEKGLKKQSVPARLPIPVPIPIPMPTSNASLHSPPEKQPAKLKSVFKNGDQQVLPSATEVQKAVFTSSTAVARPSPAPAGPLELKRPQPVMPTKSRYNQSQLPPVRPQLSRAITPKPLDGRGR